MADWQMVSALRGRQRVEERVPSMPGRPRADRLLARETRGCVSCNACGETLSDGLSLAKAATALATTARTNADKCSEEVIRRQKGIEG